jgi:Mrp family chromosome partitioning ATPase
MAGVLRACSAEFDWVLLDAPPVGAGPDTPLLVRQVSTVVLVIGAGTPFQVAAAARATLAHAHVVGTILHGVPTADGSDTDN